MTRDWKLIKMNEVYNEFVQLRAVNNEMPPSKHEPIAGCYYSMTLYMQEMHLRDGFPCLFKLN